MRILVVSSSFYPKIDGVTITIHDQTLKLVEKGHVAHIVTRRFAGTSSHETLDGIHVWRTGPAKINSLLKRLNFVLDLAVLVSKLVVNVPFDVIHAYGPTATVAAKIGSLRYRLPLVTTFTGPDPIWFPVVARKALGAYSLFINFVLLITNEATVSTDRNRKIILGLCGGRFSRKIHVIPRGVNLALFKPLKKSIQSRPVILFVGTVCHRKGADILIRAIPKILKKYPSVKVVFVGKTTVFQSELDSLIQNLGVQHAVVFTGSIKDYADMPRYFQMGDVLVLPSRSGGEGFGRVVIEAMATGLPVVASRIRGPADIITHRKNGLLFIPENTEDLAEKITELIEDKMLAIRLSSKGRKLVGERYSLESVVKQIEKVYKKALGNLYRGVATLDEEQ